MALPLLADAYLPVYTHPASAYRPPCYSTQSSRSHSIFTLHLRGSNPSLGSSLKGALNLVDLAGSERLSRSNATGSQLKETQAINKSLSCLTDVFTAIGSKAGHVPFRNSKLTHILSPALSGDGKTLMMVNMRLITHLEGLQEGASLVEPPMVHGLRTLLRCSSAQ